MFMKLKLYQITATTSSTHINTIVRFTCLLFFLDKANDNFTLHSIKINPTK